MARAPLQILFFYTAKMRLISSFNSIS